MTTQLKNMLDKITEIALGLEWSDAQMDTVANEALKLYGKPNQAVKWTPAFGGKFEIIEQPKLSPIAVRHLLIKGCFSLFGESKDFWDAYAGAQADDAFFTEANDEDGWVYIYDCEGMLIAEILRNDMTADRYTAQGGIWERV